MNFHEIYNGKKPVLSFEFFPPKKEEGLVKTRALMARLNELNPDYMTVTYGAGGGTRGFTRDLVSYIQNDLKRPAVAHLTCIGHTSDEIDSVLDDLRSCNVSNVLALRGDPPVGSDTFVKTEGGFSCARDLAKHIKQRGDFGIAVAGYPEVHEEAESADSDLEYLKEKINAGGDIIITQLFFSADIYFSFKEKAERLGITAPIVPGIMPIAKVSQVRKFTQMCGASIPDELSDQLESIKDDDEAVVKFGIEYASKLCKELLEGGAPGLHIYTLNKSKQTTPIVKSLGIR